MGLYLVFSARSSVTSSSLPATVSRMLEIWLPNVPAEDRHLYAIPLNPGRLVAFVSEDHDWAERRSATIGELVTQRIILREKGSRTRSIFEDAVAAAGHVLHDVMEISGREGVREAVAAGFGIGIVAENELVADSRLRALRVSDAELKHAEYVTCLEETRTLRVTEAFLDIVRSSQPAKD